MNICLDLHDFSVVNNRLELLLKLKEHFPDFKVSLFTVPLDTETNWGAFRIREESLQRIKDCLDWIQIIPHGLNHNSSREMDGCDYHLFKDKIIPQIKEAFDKDRLPFVKGFCAPHWRWSEGVVRALDEEGWWGAVNAREPNMLPPKRFYKYSHCLDEPYLESGLETLKLHGHIYGTRNDLGKCFANLLKLPPSVEWHFVTDFLEERV